MESEQPLEERVGPKQRRWEITKGVLIPGYGFKIWYDDRKSLGQGALWRTPGLLDVIELELFKGVGYSVAGAIVYELLNK